MGEKNIKTVIILVTFLIIVIIAILANKDVFWGSRGEFAEGTKIKGSFGIVKNMKGFMIGEENGVIKCFDSKGNLKWSYRVGDKNIEIVSNGTISIVYGKGESVIRAFDINGFKWDYNINQSIFKVRINKNGKSIIGYNYKNGDCGVKSLNVYGKEIFADKFNSGVLVDVGISNNNYFCVNQDVVSDGLIYEITKYNSSGIQVDVNTIKDVGYIGGNYIGEDIIVIDTKSIYCIENGKVLWKKAVEGKVKKVFDDNKYFVYQVVPSGTFFSQKNSIVVLDNKGDEVLNKKIDDEVSYVKSYKRGILFSGDRDIKYISFSGSKEYSLPLYNDISNADFSSDNGYVIFNSDAVSVKFKEK